jgi:electron transport complex protein RnfB
MMFTLGAAFIGILMLFYGIGYFVTWLAKPRKQDEDSQEMLIESVNTLLPQTQCAQCGYPGCRPYAEAIINQNQAINQCPPGGEATITQLAQLLGRDVLPLDSTLMPHKQPQVAFIQEENCIGCVLCIQACPVDAIVGANRYMHTVIAEECTGCELCLPPCPVDCIELHTVDKPS